MKKEEIQRLAMSVALRFHLAEFNQDIDPLDAYEQMNEENVFVWEPFEHWNFQDLEDSIYSLAYDIEDSITKALENDND